MKFTLSWLKTHLKTDADVATIANRLTMIGLEVEEITDPMETLGVFKIAEIVSAEKHPDADRLKVCKVFDGTENFQIVCGAPNARAGIKVVLAPIGAYIPAGDFKISKGNIRGVESCGMMCSFAELGLGDDADGIIELDSDAPVGESFVKWSGRDDVMIEIAITPNRGDCLGVRGIARDLSAAGLGELVTPCPAVADVDGTFDSPVVWDIQTEKAPHVMGRYFKNVKNIQSPEWLKNRLLAIGITPKTALVDITNYISYDIGRPLHVFDADKIGDTLTIRSANDSETFKALDDTQYTLKSDMTVIAHDSTVHAVGGIMGGMDSAVTVKTSNVFVESAWFDAINIAETGRALGIVSDSRYRFERTVNPLSNIFGIKAATKLIQEICGGEVSNITESGSPRFEEKIIELRLTALEKRSGIVVPENIATDILSALGFNPSLENRVIKCSIPAHRPDIEGEHCLIEEVLRIYGFENIPAVPLPKISSISKNVLTPTQKRIGLARRALAGAGVSEAVTFAFMARPHAEAFATQGVSDTMVLLNPISEDLNTMRPSILPNLLQAYKRNKSRGNGDVALFEVGGTYLGNTPADQINMIAGIRAGRTAERHWAESPRAVDVFDAKSDMFQALRAMGIATDSLQISDDTPKWYHPGQSGSVKMGKNVIATFGTLHPSALKTLGIKGSAVGFEIMIDALPVPKNKGKSRSAFIPSQFQSVRRDFAFEMDSDVASATVLRAVKGADKGLISDARIFDVFSGDGIGDGKKSVGVMVTLQPKDKTLTDQDIEAISTKITAMVIKSTGAVVR